MTEIQLKILEIKELLTDRVEHFEYSHKAKIPFKVHSFIQIMNLRMSDFCEAIDLLIDSNHIIPSLNLIRTLFENVAVTYRISSAIDKSLKSNKLIEDFDDLITKISLGTKYESDVIAIGIMTNLDKLDKEYKGIRKIYEDLCEFVHPNWDGVQGSYSKLNEIGRYTDIFKVITKEHSVFDFFVTCSLIFMDVFIDCSKSILTNLPSFSILCETEIDKKNEILRS
jgi:hypothetical protein